MQNLPIKFPNKKGILVLTPTLLKFMSLFLNKFKLVFCSDTYLPFGPNSRFLLFFFLEVVPNLHVLVKLNDGINTLHKSSVHFNLSGIGKVWRHSPGAYRDLGLTDKLYGMLRDHDSNVVTFTLQTLNIILADEGGVRVNKKMARYLLSKVKVFGLLDQSLSIPPFILGMVQNLKINLLNDQNQNDSEAKLGTVVLKGKYQKKIHQGIPSPKYILT